MISIYMDESVEGQIARGLRLRGVDVLTAEEDGRAGAPDPTVIDRAGELGRVVFSRDRDFLREAVRRQRVGESFAGESFAGVVYARKSQVPTRRCIEDLQLLAEVGVPEDFINRVYFLPL